MTVKSPNHNVSEGYNEELVMHVALCGFLNTDVTSTAGYDSIIQHLNDGKRTCKEIEDFMKARAAIEEKYAKELLGLSKKVCGHSEMNTLKRSLDVFKLQTESVSLSHLHLAQTMREEAKKLEDFREKQKEARKKVEQHMDALHKQKAAQYKKTAEASMKERAKCHQFVYCYVNDRTKTFCCINNVTLLYFKLYAKTQQAKQTAEEADRIYSQNVSLLGKMREEWLNEHVKACEFFEKQEVERINTLRNVVWTHLNHLSQQCVTSDELYEEVRKSLEQCNIQEDIEHFINLRRTGDKPPAPVPYENFYNNQRSVPTRSLPTAGRRAAAPPPPTAGNDPLYSTVAEPGYSLIRY
ncbi:proline-serine-threonine phosphatase-interacting protein 2-like [Sinocyclocheilus anshuiensis]|uniref:proline-serine-threonine phosphatase-interacting protein 2-like n=1 Tax=Sinocyclocheilus anshuiensis TaxID=1608454 RepID=UPI0007B798EE|nr:PREDICTED: proline-serine-threonine phosphatase-interacting protein 2-like [Sinocyclocheilus anshuiensis]